jgi:hypothetical protein
MFQERNAPPGRRSRRPQSVPTMRAGVTLSRHFQGAGPRGAKSAPTISRGVPLANDRVLSAGNAQQLLTLLVICLQNNSARLREECPASAGKPHPVASEPGRKAMHAELERPRIGSPRQQRNPPAFNIMKASRPPERAEHGRRPRARSAGESARPAPRGARRSTGAVQRGNAAGRVRWASRADLGRAEIGRQRGTPPRRQQPLPLPPG